MSTKIVFIAMYAYRVFMIHCLYSFKKICNLSLNMICLESMSVTGYFIGCSTNSIVIKSCIVKESFPVRAQIGLIWNVEAYVKT